MSSGTPTWTNPTTVTIPVTSVFGRTGSILALSGDYNTMLVTESGTNLYFTDIRAQNALSGTVITLSGRILSTENAITNLSGNLNTTNSNLATTNGYLATATGNILSLSGTVFNLSGSLNTLS